MVDRGCHRNSPHNQARKSLMSKRLRGFLIGLLELATVTLAWIVGGAVARAGRV